MIFNESIASLVLELGVNGHFSATSYGVHSSGVKTWLYGANTVQNSFLYILGVD